MTGTIQDINLLSKEDTLQTLLSKSFTVVDVETTGFGGVSRVIEIGAVRVESGVVTETFDSLVDPCCRITNTMIHGITDSMVHGAPRFESVLPQLMDFVHGTLFIAHNASFDIRMLVGEQELVDGVEFCVPQPYICSVRLARLAFPGLDSYKLGALVETLGIENGLAHSGLSDAMATAEMVIMLLARILKNPEPSLLKKITKLIGSTPIMGTSLPLLVQKAELYPRGNLVNTYQGQ